MEILKKIIAWLIEQSPFVKILSLVAALLCGVIILFSCTSCGTTRAVARTSDSGTTTISITTNNPISVDASPNVDLKLSKD